MKGFSSFLRNPTCAAIRLHRRKERYGQRPAGCRFNKPIARVLLVLASDDSITYTETFHIDPPSLTVGFPLPEDTVSESSGGPLPPGDYSRRVSAFTADGEEWKAPAGFFRETVTIAER